MNLCPRRRQTLLTAIAFFACLIGLRLDAAIAISASGPNPALSRQYAPGSSVTFSADAPAGERQWLHDGTPIAGATSATLTLPSLTSLDDGNYQLRVSHAETVELSETRTINVLPFPPSPVDRTFTSQLGQGEQNFCEILAVTPDGGALIRRVNFVSSSSPEVFYTAGPVDSAYSGFHFVGSNAGSFAPLAVYPQGGLVVAEASHGYRLSASGSRNHDLALPAELGFVPATLHAAAIQPDSRLLIAQFTRLARLNPDDTIDASFHAVTVADPHKFIQRLTLDSVGRIYVTTVEELSAYNPATGEPVATVISRLLADGTPDPAFTPLSSATRLTLFPLDDGRLLVLSASQSSGVFTMHTITGAAEDAWGSALPAGPVRNPVVDPRGRIFFLDSSGVIHRATVTPTSLVEDQDFYSGDGRAYDLALSSNGFLLVSGTFAAWDGHATDNVVRLRPDDSVTLPPTASISPESLPTSYGAPLVLTSRVTGAGPFTYEWLALDGQPLPSDFTSPQFTIPSLSTSNFGRYQLRVTGPGDVHVLSNVATVFPNPNPPYLANLSGRALTGSGEDTVIAGLSAKSAAGSNGLSTLLRGAGPALQPLGVGNFLPNPALDLYNSAGQLIANNDQWSANPEVAAVATTVGAFAFNPESNDAALLHDFPTGNATMMLKSQDNTAAGIGLLEIYQSHPASPDEALLNLSFRARTASGEATAIAGFVLVDPQNFHRAARVLLRAVGPTLLSQGIVHPLENPILTVYNSNGERVAQNDDWAVANSSADASTLSAAMKQVGAFDLPSESRDAALLLDLPAGAYTLHATGGSGVVLLEIYLVPTTP